MVKPPALVSETFPPVLVVDRLSVDTFVFKEAEPEPMITSRVEAVRLPPDVEMDPRLPGLKVTVVPLMVPPRFSRVPLVAALAVSASATVELMVPVEDRVTELAVMAAVPAVKASVPPIVAEPVTVMPLGLSPLVVAVTPVGITNVEKDAGTLAAVIAKVPPVATPLAPKTMLWAKVLLVAGAI